MEYMSTCLNKQFDLAIVDPIYGIYENGNRDLVPKGAACARKKYHVSLWEQKKTPPEFFKELFRVSKNQIIWGGNYFDLPISRGWLVWDKRGKCPGNDFADCELAWTSYDVSIRMFSYLWNGMLQQNMKDKEVRIHPTQKPIAVYKWILSLRAEKGFKILDTHLGSGSNRIACYDEGFDFWATEIDKTYFDDQDERFQKHLKQPKPLFTQKDLDTTSQNTLL
jgi:site-specific DNA-methyltransferase (adenine-specific)